MTSHLDERPTPTERKLSTRTPLAGAEVLASPRLAFVVALIIERNRANAGRPGDRQILLRAVMDIANGRPELHTT